MSAVSCFYVLLITVQGPERFQKLSFNDVPIRVPLNLQDKTKRGLDLALTITMPIFHSGGFFSCSGSGHYLLAQSACLAVDLGSGFVKCIVGRQMVASLSKVKLVADLRVKP